MKTVERRAPPLLVSLNRDSVVPIFRQIYSAAREAILSGRLAPGSQLPASRNLAKELGVSRTTVVLAYEHLEAEGYVVGSGSAGTCVAEIAVPKQGRRANGQSTARPSVYEVGPVFGPPVPFRLGEPALDLFPRVLWARLHSSSSRRLGPSVLGYGDPAGYLPLRNAIANYVSVSRGVKATPQQVILVRGAQQAMDVIGRVLLHAKDQVWVEDPGYLVVRGIIRLAGAVPVPVSVDKEGLVVEEGLRRAPAAKMVCVAPSHQFPLGRTLSLSRRLALLKWVRQSDAWVVEDDFDSEFRYTGSPIMSLQGLDQSGRVIYVGTFSKTVFPALRLGYVIVPQELAPKFRQVMETIDHLSPTLEQVTLTDLIEKGHFTRHVRKMRAIYRERQDALLMWAERELSGKLTIEAAETGMHAIGWLKPHLNDAAISQAAQKLGIEAPPLSRYCLRATLPPALVMGFAAYRPNEIATAVRTLGKVLS